MRSAMDEKTFLEFYKNTVLGYSNTLQRHICRLLEEQQRITFEEQRQLFDSEEVLYVESKKDFKNIVSRTTMDINFVNFYEYWEFTKLYKYSVPLFYDLDDSIDLIEVIDGKNILQFKEEDFKPEFVLDTILKDATPIYLVSDKKIYIKFVLQKTYMIPESYDQIDYRYPIVICIDTEEHCLEIRYDSMKYNASFNSEIYEKNVNSCVEWLKNELGISLYLCNHSDTIKIINDKQNEDVKMYKQMMEMGSGGAAELTASESADYVLPFIGEIRELLDENEELFDKADEIKQLLIQYINDKEATASYPYIYIKWVKPVESQSYIVKVTFDYLSHKFTLLQHITGDCKDLGMERMNDAIEYLCKSRAFTKGEGI